MAKGIVLLPDGTRVIEESPLTTTTAAAGDRTLVIDTRPEGFSPGLACAALSSLVGPENQPQSVVACVYLDCVEVFTDGGKTLNILGNQGLSPCYANLAAQLATPPLASDSSLIEECRRACLQLAGNASLPAVPVEVDLSDISFTRLLSRRECERTFHDLALAIIQASGSNRSTLTIWTVEPVCGLADTFQREFRSITVSSHQDLARGALALAMRHQA